MAANPLAVLTQITGFGVFLWVSLYLLVRAPSRTPEIVVSLVGLFSQAVFFGSGALTDTTADPALLVTLERWFWWSNVVPAATWYHLSSLIARRTQDRRVWREAPAFTPPAIVVYVVAGVLILLGLATDLFNDYANPVRAGDVYVVRPGSAYSVYMAYLVLAAVGAFGNFALALRQVAHSHRLSDRVLAEQLRLLTGGALGFLAGALWLSSRQNWGLAIPALPGYLGLLVGLAALGYGVAQLGLLLKGQNVRRDFIYNFTGIGLVNLLYAGLLLLTGLLSTGGLLALVGLVTLTHTAFDAGRNALDTLFFSRAERAARTEAREYATALGTEPVASPTLEVAPPAEMVDQQAPPHDAERSVKEFKDLVRKALTGLKSPPQLAKSPLLALKLVEQRVTLAGQPDNRLNRAAALRALLIEQIDGLRPAGGEQAAHRVGDAWRFYNVLYYPYVRELSRKSALAEARRLAEERRRAGVREPGELEQVLSWLADVDEDTFYKWQRRASDTIATIVWEENMKLSQADIAARLLEKGGV